MNDHDPSTPAPEPAPQGAPAVSPAPPPAAAASTAAAPATPGNELVLATLARDVLRDRRSERRWRVFFRLAWLGLAVAVAFGLLAQTGPTVVTAVPHTALVDVRGEIGAETEASAELIVSALRAAFEEKNAQAIVLRFNSPGGSPVQAGIVNDELRRLKAKHGKKVYAVVEEVAASGAYYIAVAADEIFVDKASIVGSIGVLIDSFGFTGVMEKLGVERRLIVAGENKGMLDPFSPLSPQHVVHAQAMIDQVHRQFVQVVRQGRGKRLKETPEMFSGLFWNGEEAVKLGLADRFGNLDQVAREVVKAEEIVDYTPRENVAERLAKRFGAGVGQGAVKALRTLPGLR